MIGDAPNSTKNTILWKRMMFKKNKVWMATDNSGKPLVKDGKVLIKYQMKQEYEYWVHEKGIYPITPDCESNGAQDQKRSTPVKSASDRKRREEQDKTAAGAIHVYTDGASSGNPGPSGIGVYIHYKGKEKEISRHIGIATNNVAELEAIRSGLLALKSNDKPVRVYTDSTYANGVLTLGWKTRKNRELVKRIKEIMGRFGNLTVIQVKGHAGDAGNERANRLATTAAAAHRDKAEAPGFK
jgi:ribonuclease HI